MSRAPAAGGAAGDAVPTATYRLQLQRGFGFREATRLVPYLARLGISHVYCSPYLRARPGSPHGYDIVDHGSLNPEIGDEADFEAFVDALRRHGMGQILDFVPNHMGVAQADNAWWLDVLEYGMASPWAEFFDIDWRPAKRELHGKVLAPFLGDHYGRVLERGELRLAFDAETGAFSVWYFTHRFPVSPRSAARLLAEGLPALAEELGADHSALVALERVLDDLAEALPAGLPVRRRQPGRERAERAKHDLARLVGAEPAVRAWVEAVVAGVPGQPDRPESWRRLHRLLEAQHYRLAYWRVAAEEINYRRFFDINELAGLRMERRDVFEAVHQRVLAWIAAGRLDGLRIDHVDGLLDPKGYCTRLREAVGRRPLYLVVEKILARHESLREDWPVDGTTGYDFLNEVGGLFVDPEGALYLDRTWQRFAPEAPPFEEMVYLCKKHVMNFLLGGELQVLGNEFDRLSETAWSTRDFTLTSVREALKEVVACFPVYRSYVRSEGASGDDRRDIDWALAQARRRSSDPETSLFDWIHAALTTDLVRRPGSGWPRRAGIRLAMRFQQYTGPVMAKALEDTSFYRYHRLASLNEVGGDPARFGVSPAAFHHASLERARRWPHAMLATSTHDTKRGEDTRLRIHVLSELPGEWDRRVARWATWNQRFKRVLDDRPAPVPADEYLLYQTLVGSWPGAGGAPPAADAPWLAAWRERVEGFAVKALREAKQRSSWRHVDAAYEEAHLEFLRALLDASRPNPFLADLAGFAARVAAVAAVHGLSQTLVKLAAPGVPDVYQGCELWNFALADPDNRRPVDFARRAALLDAIEKPDDPAGAAATALDGWAEGAPKLLVTARLLGLRRRHPELLRDGAYRPLEVEGPRADRIVAFARSAGQRRLVVVVPRLVAPLLPVGAGPRIPAAAWADTVVRLPDDDGPRRLRDAVTGAVVQADAAPAGAPTLRVARLLESFPVAALVGGLEAPA